MSLIATEIHYRLPGRGAGVFPGAHRSSAVGGGDRYHGVTEFFRHPDARHLDLRRTWLDPYRRPYVKTFEQRSAVTVVAAVDLSASMGVFPERLARVSALIQGLAWGSRRLGDRFGCVGFDDRIRLDTAVPPGRATGAVVPWCRWMTSACRGRSAVGALALRDWLPGRRCLVVLISDFHWPETLLRSVLAGLSEHWVVPVVLCDRRETAGWPRWGIRRVVDAESGRERLIWLRPGWRRALETRYRDRRARLRRLFQAATLPALWWSETMGMSQVSHHFERLGT